MKVAMLAAASSIHTIRWANGLAERGLEVHLISIHEPLPEYRLDSAVKFHFLKSKLPFGYMSAFKQLRALLQQINPSLLNAHYATGYGLLARLSGFHPLLLSVWGSDVYDFPNKSFLNRLILKGNLENANAIASTSHCMAKQTAKTYVYQNGFITPFGIDVNKFKPIGKNAISPNVIHIGTVKTLSEKYGIDTLIESFALLVKERKEKEFRLTIAGSGSNEQALKSLAEALDIADSVTFSGFIKHEDVPALLNQFDIYVALSRWESFGVAILEANACGLPVVVSDADGLKEVVRNNETGFVVPKNSPEKTCKALLKLVDNELLRRDMGNAGLQHVLKNYTWDHSLDMMINAYSKTVMEFYDG